VSETIIGRCRTCAHWKPGSAYRATLGSCGRVEDADAFTPYVVPSYRREPAPDTMAVGTDGGFTFVTGPEFGCVHHTPAS
jgi:hypothetical protein